jgi:hypothetical protein
MSEDVLLLGSFCALIGAVALYDCYGRSPSMPPMKECPTCDGDGELICGACGGGGCHEFHCWSCGSKGSEVCRTCAGSGEVEVEPGEEDDNDEE